MDCPRRSALYEKHTVDRGNAAGMKIYTKTGDAGETGLYGGPRVSKDAPRIEACGDVDECAAGADGCAVLCTNTPGSFACGCSAGFQLRPDGLTCAPLACSPTQLDRSNREAAGSVAGTTGDVVAAACDLGYGPDGAFTCTARL